MKLGIVAKIRMDVGATPLCLTKDAPNLENGIRNVKPLSIFMTYTFLSFCKCCQNKNLVSNYSAASASTTMWMALRYKVEFLNQILILLI